MEVVPVPILGDNFAYLLVRGGRAWVVDPGEALPVVAAARERGLTVETILLTHHHADHVAGAAEVARAFGAKTAGPLADGVAADEDLVPGEIEVFGEGARVFEVPGHTRHHIAVFFPARGDLVCGDILFVAGCGRLFEGRADATWAAFEREILPLPDATRVWPGHDYAVKNLRFAADVTPPETPHGEAVRKRLAEAEAAARDGRPFIPSTIGEEKRTNPFLLAALPEYRAAIARRFGALPDAAAAFAALRRARDAF